jgi:hypothetical protein
LCGHKKLLSNYKIRIYPVVKKRIYAINIPC